MQCKTCLFAIIIIARSAYVPWSLKGRPARLRSVAVLMASRCVHGLAWLPRNDCHLLPQLVHLLLDDRCRASEGFTHGHHQPKQCSLLRLETASSPGAALKQGQHNQLPDVPGRPIKQEREHSLT